MVNSSVETYCVLRLTKLSLHVYAASYLMELLLFSNKILRIVPLCQIDVRTA